MTKLPSLTGKFIDLIVTKIGVFIAVMATASMTLMPIRVHHDVRKV